jgi:hypothetical protein
METWGLAPPVDAGELFNLTTMTGRMSPRTTEMPLRRLRSLILVLSPLLAVGIIAAALALRVNTAHVADMPTVDFGAAATHQPRGA